MSRLKVDFAGIAFKNPVALCSGTCGFGRELNELFDIAQLGGISLKGLTLKPRPGNEGHRIWETPSGIMNSVGLENPGVEGFIQQELPWMNQRDVVSIVNLGGHTTEDYLEGLRLLDGHKYDILELNISCPNVKKGGMSFGVKTELAREIVKKSRALCSHKLVVKLSPNAEDIVALARACEEEGADGISMINTFLGLAIDMKTKKSAFENGYAGVSGPAIRPMALRMVNQVSKAVKIPIMGMGGIVTWEDAVQFIMAGATVVQIGTATFIKPDICLDVIHGIERYMEREKISCLEEIRGII